LTHPKPDVTNELWLLAPPQVSSVCARSNREDGPCQRSW
jgi:hypothetical protein